MMESKVSNTRNVVILKQGGGRDGVPAADICRKADIGRAALLAGGSATKNLGGVLSPSQ